MQLKSLAIALAATAAILGAAACSDDENDSPANTPATSPTTSATTAPTVAPRPLKDVLKDAINEEYKARATYQAIIAKFGEVTPFVNILAAENNHVEAWKRIYDANKLDVPPDIYAGRIVAPADLKKACEEGVAAEKADVALYDALMKETTDAEALKVMTEQRKVSQENHLPAFEACAK